MELAKNIKSYFSENYKDILSALFFFVCIGTSVFLYSGGMANFASSTDLPFGLFIILAVFEIIMLVTFIYIEKKFFGMPINIPIIIVLSILFVTNILVISTTPLENTISYTVGEEHLVTLITIDNLDKIIYIFEFALFLLSNYIMIVYPLYRFKSKVHFMWIAIIVIVFAFICVIYSYATEWETYKLYFDNIATTLKSYNPHSLTFNSNDYAAILLGAIYCCFACNMITKKRIFWIIAIFFGLNIPFPMSRICLILTVAIFLLFFGYKMFMSWKGHEVRNANIIFLVALIIIVLVLIGVYVPNARNYLENVVFVKIGDFTGRKQLWAFTIEITKGWHIAFGNGHGYFNTVFATIKTVKSPHNLYLQAYGAGGIVLLVFLFALLCFVIYKIARLYKTNQGSFFASLLGMLLFLSYFVFER